MKKLNKDFIKFNKSNKKTTYNFFKRKIVIETLKNKNQINKLKNKSVTAILDGRMINSENKTVLSYGEIIKTKTLKILSKKFSIQNKIIILNVN